MDQSEKDVIQYLKETLGLKTIHLNSDEISDHYFAVFSIEMLSTYAPSEIELLEKMISSLQWGNVKCTVCDSTQLPRVKSQYVVSFVNSFTVDTKDTSKTHIYVPSPRVLGLKPELKKVAWDQLKKALLWS